MERRRLIDVLRVGVEKMILYHVLAGIFPEVEDVGWYRLFPIIASERYQWFKGEDSM